MTRILETSVLAAHFSHHQFARFIQARRYSQLKGGGSGTYVLGRASGRLIYKISDDAGLRSFADFLRRQGKHAALPHVFGLSDPAHPWTVLVLERMRRLPPSQERDWAQWFESYLFHKQTPPSDPFGIVSLLNDLFAHANITKSEVDLLKADNIMIRRGGQIALSDPLF